MLFSSYESVGRGFEPLCCLKAPLGLSLLRKRKFLREEYPRQLEAFLCVHLSDGFKNHFSYDSSLFCDRIKNIKRFVFRGKRNIVQIRNKGRTDYFIKLKGNIL